MTQQQKHDATRHALRQVSFDKQDTNAALWLDRFIQTHDRKATDSRSNFVKEVAEASVPNIYRHFFLHWYDALAAHGASQPTTQIAFARVDGRLAIGLGAEGVLETAIALHHVFGTPFVPGSALKGVTAAYVRQRFSETDWGPKTEAYRTLFGTTAEAGYVTFFDALFVPDTGCGKEHVPLVPDVMTVHHPDYYQGNKAPADWDSPNPVPFLTATGVYLLALDGPHAWVTFAHTVLVDALREMGIGAKTSSGYGRMTVLNGDDEQKMKQHIATLRTRQTTTSKTLPQLSSTADAPIANHESTGNAQDQTLPPPPTITGRVLTVASNNKEASVQFDRCNKRLPITPALTSIIRSGDLIRARTDDAGNPEEIIGLAE